jgi:hypothetical protein
MKNYTSICAVLMGLGCPADPEGGNDDTTAGDSTGDVVVPDDGVDDGIPTPEESSSGGPAGSSGGSTASPEDTGTTGTPSDDSTGSGSTGPVAPEDGSSSSDGGPPPSAVCVLYCDEFLPNCNTLPGVEAYDDVDDCLDTCAPWEEGPAGLFAGDTVTCRVDHLTFDPNPGPGYYELHCFHAQEHPTSQCI